MPRPDFYLVGALKSGTSAMASYLGQHPDIYLPVKEVCFFGSDLEFRRTLHRTGDWFRPSEERYLSFFDNHANQARIGEASAYYLCSTRAAAEIQAFSPNASIIVMLRNPADMLRSMHNHWLFSLNEDIADFGEALSAEEDRRNDRRIPESAFWPHGLCYRSIPKYSEQLERFFGVFGRERVNVVLFDDFRDNTRETYARILQSLGVDPSYEANFEIVNPSRQARSRVLQRLFVDPPQWVRKLARPILDNPKLREQARRAANQLNTRVASRPATSPAIRAELTEYFRPEVERLSELLQRDLSAWNE
jgi:hypothetical protein